MCPTCGEKPYAEVENRIMNTLLTENKLYPILGAGVCLCSSQNQSGIVEFYLPRRMARCLTALRGKAS